VNKSTYALWVLFAINAMNFFDRTIGGALGEPVRREWDLSDSALGALGTAFTILYAFAGVPLGRLSDRMPRKHLLAGGVFVWSLLTSVSGFARNFWQLFVMRLGVGVGEAVCAPAGTSLIGDLFPPARRARALSIFMLGLPIGIALSYLVGSFIAFRWGWRAAFFVSGIPGVLCAVAAIFIAEPARGMSESRPAAEASVDRSPYKHVLSIPTMWWLILSGAFHNYNMYALGSFLSPFLMRYHAIDLRQAGLVSMTVYGLSGIPGLLLGGYLADTASKRRKNGRLLVGATSIVLSVPLLLLALGRPPRGIATFVVLAGLGCMLMYVYYSSVYAAIQDVIKPSLRGTAMALYFFAMYVLGASLGPLGTGFVSDYYTKKAAAAAGVTGLDARALEPFRAEGLHSAMYMIPVLSVLLAIVLFAASRTVARDMDRRDAIS
jgi:predicted MFS family arabinose efflux permease